MSRGKQYVKKGVWYLGGNRKKKKKGQKGRRYSYRISCFSSCTCTKANSVTDIKTNIWKRKKKNQVMVKQTVILRKRANPKTVNLPDGRSFISRWERISRKQLPINIKVKRQRTIGAIRNNRRIYLNQAAPALRKINKRRRNEAIERLMPIYDRVNQSGSGLASNLAKAGLEPGSKALGSEFGKKIINKGIDSIPNIFRFGVSKIKNKNVKRVMKSDIAKMVVNEAKTEQKLNPSNRMNKFINHAAMISDRGKYPFIIANTDAEGKLGVHWWSILDIEPRNDIFFFDSFGIEGLKYFIIQDDKNTVEKILLGIKKMDRSDKKITLCKIEFNMGAYKKFLFLFKKSARNFFYFIHAFE